MDLKRIHYGSLNARQKENYNYSKISAVLADFGFVTIRLSDDWNGADFLALHIDGDTLKVQLKPRLTLEKKYMNKDIWVCFPHSGAWYLYPHDEVLDVLLADTTIADSSSWSEKGVYSFNTLPKKIAAHLERYRITS
jgi:hypothetical protein